MGSLVSLRGLLLLAMILMAVALALTGIGQLTGQGRAEARRRIGAAGEAGAALPSARFGSNGWFSRVVVDRLKGRLVQDGDPEQDTVRLRLHQAGIYSPHAVPAYYVIRLLLGGGLPLLFGPVAPLLVGHPSLGQVMGMTLMLAGLGYAAPAVTLGRRVADRQRQVREGFPDALDLMIICVEAGLGQDAAVARVGQEIAAAHPVLAEHFTLLAAEFRAGKSREEAWRAMASRIGLPEVASLVLLLVQTEALGASPVEALRSHVASQRSQRLLKAEEKAQQLAVKMTIPLILMILPALMIVITTPALIRGWRTLLPILHQSIR